MIWNIAQKQNYDWLKYRLFYRLVSFYNENTSSSTISRSLVETFFPFQPTNSEDATVIKIIQALQFLQPDRQLAELSFKNLQTPRTLFIKNCLPYQLPVVKRSLNHVIFPLVNTRSLDSDRVSWFLDCLEEMDREQELQAVENLLKSQMSDRPIEIANWLKNNYGLGIANSRWNELSSEAKIKLRQWIGAINYQNFDSFINLLIKRLDLNEKQENQLIKRKEFWSNYSNKFKKINILLPLESATTLNINTDNIEFTILENDGNDLAEICIFDFGDKIIIEFFRGRVSETRLLDKTFQLESDLFDNKRKLSITYLRSLGGKVHDHVFCWQYYCERWLAQHNIFPNQGITQFKVSPNKYNRYSIEQGLPKPSFHDMQERQEQEQRWLEKIKRLERQSIDFISKLDSES